jgi:DNA-binding transcriptional LysR family regulator
MNWQQISFDWNQVRAFLVTAEEGSLSAAARALGLTQPTLSRQVMALEEQLGVTLFERIGKTLRLTQSGKDLLDHVREMGEAARKLSLVASGQSQSVSGTVSLTASDTMAYENLPAFLMQLRSEAPLIDIEVIADNEISDLLRREADIAIRHVRPEEPDLIARLVGEITASFYASKSYQEMHGCPQTVADLSQHHFVGFGDRDRMVQYLQAMGLPISKEQFHVTSKSGIVAWKLVCEGLGISMMSDQVAISYPEVERLSLPIEPLRIPIWLTTHRELHTSRKIRLVFDRLAEYLASLYQ